MALWNKSRKSAGMVYAVVSGSQPGIYYEWKGGAELAIRGIATAEFQSFPSLAAAQRYLKSQGLKPKSDDYDGWMSSKSREPILYHPKDDVEIDDETGVTTTISEDTGERPTLTGKRKSSDISRNLSSEDSSSKHARNDKDSHPSSSQNDTKDKSQKQTKISFQPKLDPIQQHAVDAAMNGKNVFLTGVAGTGKSLVTKLIYEQALERYGSSLSSRSQVNSSSTSSYTGRRKHTQTSIVPQRSSKKVALCAPTGMAAVGLGMNGQTIHTLAGIKVPARASDFNSMLSPGNRKKWESLECLIIDEVGMLSADFLDWLDVQVRQVRHCLLEPFGGIQLIFVGDFAQLGPVPGSLSLHQHINFPGRRGPPYPPEAPEADCFLNIKECTGFAFQSALWREADFTHVHLQRVYRQSDRDFVEALMDLREQRSQSDRVQELVRKCSTPLQDSAARIETFGDQAIDIPQGMLPTLLYTTNRNADRENAEQLALLTTEHKRFEAKDSIDIDKEVPAQALGYVQKNLHNNKFFEQCQAAKHLDLKIGAQVMLVQNMSTENELVNGSRGVVERFRLVPVVRDGSETQERLLGPDDSDLYPGYTFEQLKFGMMFKFEDKHWTIFKFVKMPEVRFLNNRTKIIIPTIFERTLFRQGTCRRLQLPLRLSWALTIHKAQGCSLDFLICDLAGCFTAGQAYVALSRAKSMPGLQIRNFSARAVLTNPLVDEFYQALAAHAVPDFLREKAGLWWYPLLDHPEWLKMFAQASKTSLASRNSAQFREWIANYPPPDNYQGWRGFVDVRPSSTPVSAPRRSLQGPSPCGKLGWTPPSGAKTIKPSTISQYFAKNAQYFAKHVSNTT